MWMAVCYLRCDVFYGEIVIKSLFINLMRVFGFDISLPTEQFALLLNHENQYEYH